MKADETTFCAICRPEMKYGVIEPSLIDPQHPISDRYKKTVVWSYTQVPPLRPHPATFWIPESAIVKCQTLRWDNNHLRWIIFEGEKREHGDYARISITFCHLENICYRYWWQRGWHEGVWFVPSRTQNQYPRMYDYSHAYLLNW
ncbi:MAG: hypothetical protein ABIK80_03745 [candidate division WOR-3 bacterium]